jgi:hypothetical protein
VLKSLIVTLILCFCIACGSQKHSFSRLAEDPSTIQMEDSATVEVRCDGQDVPAGEDPYSVLEKIGVLRGAQDVFNAWLTQRLLFPEYDADKSAADKSAADKSACDISASEGDEFVHIPLTAYAEHEEETDMYAQSFKVQVELRPWAGFRGEIIDLQESRSMAAGFDQILIQGREWIARAEGSFFVVARPVPEIKGQAMRMIGSGQIYQVLGAFAQGKLLETNREIRVGDVIYPVWISARALPVEEPVAKDTGIEDIQEVIVEPKTLPSKSSWSAPEEPK